ncbi:flavin reductase family protein [Gordonia sp. NPDC003376]
MTVTHLHTAEAAAAGIRGVLAHCPSGVAAVAARVDGRDQVMVVSSFTVGVSLEPTLVMFAAQCSSATWPVLRRAERLGVSVLSADQAGVCRQLAGPDRARRWDGVDLGRHSGDAITLDGAVLRLGTRLRSAFAAGDHEVVMLEVEEMSADDDIEPLIFHRSGFHTIARRESD